MYLTDPELVSRFERFLSGLSKDLRRRTTEQERMAEAVKSQSHIQVCTSILTTYLVVGEMLNYDFTFKEERLRRLYEEMDSQLGAERRQRKEEEERREQKLREEWEATLQMKDQQVSKGSLSDTGALVVNLKTVSGRGRPGQDTRAPGAA